MKYMFILVACFIVMFPTFALAQSTGFEGSPEIGVGTYQSDGYTRVQTYDGSGLVTCEGPDCNWCSVVSMVNRIITWLIAFLSVVAVGVMVIAGFRMVTSGGDKAAWQSGKSMFTNVVIGIIIVLSAWLIVDTTLSVLTGKGINEWLPDDCGGAFTSTSGPTTSVTTTTGTGDEAVVRQQLEALGYSINKASCNGASYQSVSGGCTSVGGFTSGMLTSLEALSRSCTGCALVITGGSEAGHQTHDDGNSVDLRFDSRLDSYLNSGGGTTVGLRCVREYNPNHWHCRS